MKDFISSYYSVVYRIIIIAAALTGFIVYHKFKKTHSKYLMWFLLWVVVVEITAYYPEFLIDLGRYHLIEGSLFQNNYWVYTFGWTLGSTMFYPWFLRKKYKSESLAKVIRYLQYGFIILFLGELGSDYFGLFTESPPISLIIANMIVVLLSSIFYLFEILNSDRVLTFYKSIYFYVASLCFVWWLVHTPVKFFQVYHTGADWDYIVLRNLIKLTVNIIMYFGFIVALIVSKPEYD